MGSTGVNACLFIFLPLMVHKLERLELKLSKWAKMGNILPLTTSDRPLIFELS